MGLETGCFEITKLDKVYLTYKSEEGHPGWPTGIVVGYMLRDTNEYFFF